MKLFRGRKGVGDGGELEGIFYFVFVRFVIVRFFDCLRVVRNLRF